MPKTYRFPLALLSTVTLLAGCGGGGGDGNSGSTPINGYAFVTPTIGARQIYAQTTVDNSSNTISQVVRHYVTGVNPDGSYVFVQDDPTGNSVMSNGTRYTIPSETISVSNTGRTQAYSYTPVGSSTSVTCNYSTSGTTNGYPIVLGQTWNFVYAVTCGEMTPTQFTEVGGISDVESVIVPAGTFTTIKGQSTVTWTNTTGTTRTESITTWRDTQTSLLVKRVISYSYSGTQLANGYPVSVTMALQSKT